MRRGARYITISLLATAALLPGSAYAAQEVVFLNFDGVTLSAPAAGKGDDAAKGVSELVRRLGKQTLTIPPAQFPTSSPRDLTIKVLLADVKAHYRGLNIKWVTQRPIDDRYSMVVVGGASELLGTKEREIGWGPTDCGNKNPRNVAFVFSQTIAAQSGQWDNTKIAATISQEIAHGLGLEHVDGPDDLLMRPVPALVGQYRFADSCHTIVPGPVVGPNDELGCGVSPGCPKGQQNDRAVLTAVLGLKTPQDPGSKPGANPTGVAPGTSTQGATPSGEQGSDRGCGVDSSRPGAFFLGLWLLGLRVGRRRP